MSGLILKLRPREELMINGVLVENGDRNARLRIKTEGAHVLRMRDALKPEEADTPLKRVYYIAQLAVSGEITNTEAAAILRSAVENFSPEELCSDIKAKIAAGDYYQVMRCLRADVLTDRNCAAPATASSRAPEATAPLRSAVG